MSDLTINRRIDGDINRSYKSKYEQYGPQRFLEEIDKLLDIKGVKAVVWEQYTPYFNDGDACEFSFYEVRVKLSKRFYADDEEFEDGGDYGDGTLSTYELYSGSYHNPVYVRNGQDTEEIYQALRAFPSAHLEDVALANFGDHAKVTATKDGFEVEFYDHD